MKAGVGKWGAVLATCALLAGCDGGGTSQSAPRAVFAVTPAAGAPSTVFAVDAEGCSDDRTSPANLQVCWDWENDGVDDTAWSAEKCATYQYPAVGTYTIRLQVRDEHGKIGATTQIVTVRPAILLAPANVTLTVGGQQQFTPTFDGLPNGPLTWSATGGAIDNGHYTAPVTPGVYTIRAVSVDDPSVQAEARVTVQAGGLDIVIE